MPRVGELQNLCTPRSPPHRRACHATSYDNQACTLPAGPGEILALRNLLLERELESSIVSTSDVVLWVVPSKALKAILRNYPDLSLHLFRLAFGKRGRLHRGAAGGA